jgi:hypothetical protein
MGNLSIDTLYCNTGFDCANTGMPACVFTMGTIGGFDLLPTGKGYTQAQTLAFQAALAADAAADLPANRIYPFKGIHSYERANIEQVVQTDGTSKFFIRDGRIGFKFKMYESDCMFAKMKNFSGRQNQFDILFSDITNNAKVGVRQTNATGPLLKGFKMHYFNVGMYNSATTTERSFYEIEIILDNPKDFERKGFVAFDSDTNVMDVVTGLIDFKYEVVTPMTSAGVIVVKAKSGCNASDLAPTFGTNLGQGSAWKASRNDTGAVIIVASAVYNSANINWTVTLTLPALGSMPIGTELTIASAAPSVLSITPINMPGYVGCPLSITRLS